MNDADAYTRRLVDANPLREPTLRSAIQALALPAHSRGLDVGCGVGLQCLLLADAAGESGHVTGLDLSPDMLRYGEEMVKRAGMERRISFQQGDAAHLPWDDKTFDWLWSCDCAGYPAGNLAPQLREMSRVVRPGGSVVILAWSSQQLLPGFSLLEARLNATCSAYAPFLKDKRPEQHFLRAFGAFQAAGFEKVAAQTFCGDICAPLGGGVRQAMISLFEMLWGERQPDASQDDWAEYLRLCRPESPDLIVDLPDYYAFFTYSMFRGRVP